MSPPSLAPRQSRRKEAPVAASGPRGLGLASPVVQRQPQPDPQPAESPAQVDRPRRGIPDTPFSVTPQAADPADKAPHLFGHRLPYRHLRFDNLPEPAPPLDLPEDWRALLHHAARRWPKGTLESLPPSTLSLGDEGLIGATIGSLPLQDVPDAVPGAPLDGRPDEDQLRRHALVGPALSIGHRAVLDGRLSLRDPYPRHLVDPTEVDLHAESVPFDAIHGRLRGDRLDFGEVASVHAKALGLGRADASVRAFIEMDRLARALAPAGIDPRQWPALQRQLGGLVEQALQDLAQPADLAALLGKVKGLPASEALRQQVAGVLAQLAPPGTDAAALDRAAGELLAELRGPGLSLRGPVYLGLPVPIGYGYFSADTTRAVRAPFAGSAIGLPGPATLATIGLTSIPAGVVSDTTAPAFGGILARDTERLALSASIAARPYLAPGAIGLVGTANARIATRVLGFDLTLEGGWRGHSAPGGSGRTPGRAATEGVQDDPMKAGMVDLATARRAALGRFDDAAEGDERGVFSPGLQPPEVLSDARPNAEFYGMFTIGRKFGSGWR